MYRSDDALHSDKSGSGQGGSGQAEEEKFLSGDYKLSSDDDRDSLSGSYSKSMPEGSLRSVLKSSRSADRYVASCEYSVSVLVELLLYQ